MLRRHFVPSPLMGWSRQYVLALPGLFRIAVPVGTTSVLNGTDVPILLSNVVGALLETIMVGFLETVDLGVTLQVLRHMVWACVR